MKNLKTFEEFDPFGIKKRKDRKAEEKRREEEKEAERERKREKMIEDMEERLDRGEITKDEWTTFMSHMH